MDKVWKPLSTTQAVLSVTMVKHNLHGHNTNAKVNHDIFDKEK